MSFDAAEFRFAVIPFGSAADASCAHEFEWYLDDSLAESGRLPSLESAPVASWLIARMRAIDDSIPAEISEHNDGGGFCLEIGVAEGERIVAAFQLQGDMEGIAAIGRADDAGTADRILRQFVQRLTQSANEVAECCYTVVDPEWQMEPDCFVPMPSEDSLNEYGWKDGSYLGAHNIREA